MLTKFDESLCHQTLTTFEQPLNSDRNWRERVALWALDRSGQVMIMAGFGSYLNRNVMDAFAAVIADDIQYTVRSSRELRPNLETVAAGPLRYEVMEPLKKVGAHLAENDYGISFDVEFHDRMPPLEDPRDAPTRVNGILLNDAIRYWALGRASGRVTVKGKTYEIDKDNWWSVRDHSWGIGPAGMGWAGSKLQIEPDAGAPESGLQPLSPSFLWKDGPAVRRREPMGFTLAVGFDEWGTVLRTRLSPSAGFRSGNLWHSDSRPPLAITHMAQEVDWDPAARLLRSARLDVTTSDGAKRTIAIKALRVLHARAGGYLGSYKGFCHGKWMGPSWIDGGELHLNDRQAVEGVTGLEEHLVEAKCGHETGYGACELY